MSQYFVWMILSAITGSPIGSAAALLVFWLVTDRFTLGVLPDPLKWIPRLRREGQLRRTLLNNPHDGRARLELAQLYVERGAGAKAVEVLKPNLSKGEGDVQTVFTMGAACMGAKYFEQGEMLLAHAKALDPDFRVGEIDLELGKGRLARGDFPGAKAALDELLAHRRGTIMGRVLLSRALKGAGDDGAAALMRDEAWGEYVAAPGFQRRRERLWAWRARPSRPLLYLGLVLVGLFAFSHFVGPQLRGAMQQQGRSAPDDEDE
jgi:tetratricopeptide (TPR) repeat protein